MAEPGAATTGESTAALTLNQVTNPDRPSDQENVNLPTVGVPTVAALPTNTVEEPV